MSDVAAMEARAVAMRRALMDKLATETADARGKVDGLKQAREAAQAGAKAAERGATEALDQAKSQTEAAKRLDAKAAKLQDTNPKEAADLREGAERSRAYAEQATTRAQRSQADAERYREEVTRVDAEVVTAERHSEKLDETLGYAESHLDRFEDKVGRLRRVDDMRDKADEFDAEAARLEALGDAKGAASAADFAKTYHGYADTAQKEADAIVVDEAAFSQAGISEPEPVAATDAEASDDVTGAAGEDTVGDSSADTAVAMADDGSSVETDTSDQQQDEPDVDPGTGDADPFQPEQETQPEPETYADAGVGFGAPEEQSYDSYSEQPPDGSDTYSASEPDVDEYA